MSKFPSYPVFDETLAGQGLDGNGFPEKQGIPNNGGNTLQVSANTGSGNGLINEIFPDELFEADVRMNGVTGFHLQSDGTISNSYSNIQRHSQVRIKLPFVELNINSNIYL